MLAYMEYGGLDTLSHNEARLVGPRAPDPPISAVKPAPENVRQAAALPYRSRNLPLLTRLCENTAVTFA